MKGNDLAACLVIALGVGGTIIGSLLAPVNEPVTLPAVNPQPVMMETPAPEPTTTPEPTPEPTPTVETVHFSATGDDLIHDGIFLQAKERGGDHYDFDAAYAAMQGYYDQFDVNWLNQETLVNDEFAASGYPMFSTPGATDTLYNLGFRVFSLSNNHSYDKGAAGIEASMAHWAAMPDDVVTMGFYNLSTYDDYVYQTVNGITFGYLSYTEHTNGLPTPSGTDYGVVYLDDHETIAKQQITDMRPNCDVLIVSAHMGTEGTHEINDFQKQTAQWLADQGVDVIIGTHPHTVQAIEYDELAGTLVAYSLGDFFGDASRGGTNYSIILDLEITKDSSTGTTKVTNYSYTPIYTVSEVETADGYRRVVRIDKTVEAWGENYLDKVSQSAKESMVYALERIEARINPPVEEKKK